MKITVEFELRIDGKYTQKKVRENFLEWFTPSLSKFKLSPDADDEEYQVWIERLALKEKQ